MNETVAQLKEYMKKFQQYQTIESPQNHSVLLHRKNTAKS